MKKPLIITLTLLLAVGCSEQRQTDAPDTKAEAIAANTRPDGSVIDESKPHEHSDETAHDDAMDMTSTPAAGDSAATRGYKTSMTRMMQSAPPYTGDADIDFNKQMRVHHIAAVDMAEVQLANGKDAESKALAQEIIAAQKKEIAQIDAWLQKRGQ